MAGGWYNCTPVQTGRQCNDRAECRHHLGGKQVDKENTMESFKYESSRIYFPQIPAEKNRRLPQIW
jgi:hypothetical protein